MKPIVISFVLAMGIVGTSACNKNQPDQMTPNQVSEPAPEAASPNESPATVTLADGTRYRGRLVSKNGSQMTFRGNNGATRTFDSQDIQSIRFGDGESPQTVSTRPLRSAESSPRPARFSTFPASSAPVDRDVFIPSGTQISVRTNEGIDSKTASAGQRFPAVIASDILDNNGLVAIPRGAAATLIVREAGAGKIHANDLALDLSSIVVSGAPREVQTGTFYQKGRDGIGANKRTAVFSGGGAAVGALIGGLVGGGKGAAIGAASGAGAGAGTQILTRGSVKIPAESLMTFKLETPLTL